MKKRLTFITILMLFCSTMFGQSHWTYTNICTYNMTISASVTVDGVLPINHDGYELAAFHNNTLRGVAVAEYFPPTGKYVFTLTIGGMTDGEEIRFKLFDPTNGEFGKELSTDYFVGFKKDDMIGNAINPINIDFYERHWESNGVYESTMSIVSTITIDGVPQNRTNIEVAAFCGNELRGATRLEKLGNTEIYLASIYVGGKDGETISFKLYDPAIDMELNTEYTTEFVENTSIGESEPFSINFINQSVAKVGETYYTTLAAAVDAAGTGEMGTTITLLKDVEGSGVVINKSLTIDFNGKKYTFTSPAVGSNGTPTQGFQILKDNTVTLQNGTLNVAEAAGTDFAMLIQNYANLTVNNMTLNGDNLDRYTIKDYDYSYVLSNNSGEVYINNTIILANPGAEENDGHYGVAFDVCKYASYTAPVVTLDATSTISGIVELSGGELYTSQEIDIVVKKEFKAGADWGTISVPVVEALIPEATAGIHDLYRYDEPSATWQYYKDSVNGGNAENPFATLKLGQGYLYANAADIELVLEGKLNSADVVDFPLSYTEGNNLAGFNMVGNPFAYSIGLGNFATEASLADGFYTIGAGGAWIAQTEGQKIAPMEAVLVKADQAANMTINAGQQQGTKRNQPKAYLAINVANSEFEDVAYVSFSEGMGLDKISHRNADVPMVSVPVDGKEYAIAIMNEDVTEIPVTFKASTIGEYTFSAEGIECEFSKLTLVDRQTGNTTNLLLEDYTFMATSNDNVNRFFLQIDNSQPSTDSSDFAYINNGMIKIDNIEGNGVVRVLDVLGRPVAEYDVQETANIPTASFANGVYMIQMMDNNGVKVQKIIID